MLVTELSSKHISTPRSNPTPRRKGPPAALRIHAPAQAPPIALALEHDSSASSTLSSANSDMDSTYSQSVNKPPKSRSMKNTKNLSLALSPPQPNVPENSLPWPSETVSLQAPPPDQRPGPGPERKRRPSSLSLPSSNNPTSISRLHRKDEDESSMPYADGPVQILPGVWLGSEDNARDWGCLLGKGIGSILNVAKEVNSPFDALVSSQSLRPVASAPDLAEQRSGRNGTFYPAHSPSGRPAMHYLKLPWSHGQPDLVNVGFVTAMEFIDAALERGEGVLIHCQCGVSRSATVVIALVMRAAALSLSSVPPAVWALKDSGMHGAYSFVKDKSSCIGPNMSLIYQLLEYEHKLQRMNSSVSTSERSSVVAEDEEEWSRRRQMMEEDTTSFDMDRESVEVLREARALDKAMEDRIVARKASSSSAGSSSGGLGMGPAWKSRYGGGRARTGSIASNFTSGSILSEDLVEENEELDLLGVGGGFDCPSISARSPSEETTEEDSRAPSVTGQSDRVASSSHVPAPVTARPETGKLLYQLTEAKASIPPPSAPATKTSFGFTSRLPFRFRSKRRQSSLGVLPPVPSSPVVSAPPPPPESRKREVKRVPPPLRLESSTHGRTSSHSSRSSLRTASQTLFVFPPSPTLTTQTPSTLTITSSMNMSPRHTTLCTPRVSSFDLNGRRRSFIGLGIPPTPTTACSRVDARGWVGVGPG